MLGELIMAAPDVDRNVFEDLAPKARKLTTGATVYASSVDRALVASRVFAGEVPRAGEVFEGSPVIVPGIDTIDATAIGSELLNHGLYAQSRSILNDINALLRTGTRPPHLRLPVEIRAVPENSSAPTYWRYVS